MPVIVLLGGYDSEQEGLDSYFHGIQNLVKGKEQ